MVLRSWSKNKKAAATLRRSNVATLQRAAETQHPDVAMLPNDVATLGVDFGWIFSPFLAHNGGLKSSNRRDRRGGGLVIDFGAF